MSAEEFLRNPEKYRHLLGKSNVSYMRPVSEAESIAYAINIKKLGKGKRPPINKNPTKLENWIYKIRDPYVKFEMLKQKQGEQENN